MKWWQKIKKKKRKNKKGRRSESLPLLHVVVEPFSVLFWFWFGKGSQKRKAQTKACFCIATTMRNTDNNHNSEEDQRKKESTNASLDSRFNQTLRNVQGYESPIPNSQEFSFPTSHSYLLEFSLRFENPFQ
jgi:hypothetical protein